MIARAVAPAQLGLPEVVDQQLARPEQLAAAGGQPRRSPRNRTTVRPRRRRRRPRHRRGDLSRHLHPGVGRIQQRAMPRRGRASPGPAGGHQTRRVRVRRRLAPTPSHSATHPPAPAPPAPATPAPRATHTQAPPPDPSHHPPTRRTPRRRPTPPLTNRSRPTSRCRCSRSCLCRSCFLILFPILCLSVSAAHSCVAPPPPTM